MSEPSPEDLSAARNGDDFDGEPPASTTPAKKAGPGNPYLKPTSGDRERRRKAYTPDPHRLLPQSPDSEKATLSSFLIAPREIGALLAEKGVSDEWFAVPSHQEIFKLLMKMWDIMEPIDFITLTQYARDLDLLDICGGAAFITELFTFLPTAANAPYYIEILREKLRLRRIIMTGTEFSSRAYDEQDNDDLADEFEAAVLRIRQEMSIQELLTTKQATIAALERIELVYANRGSLTGLATGFGDIDRITDGLHPEELVIIAGRPSNGKTALAMNMAEHIALVLGKPVGVFSLEMSTTMLIQRMLCSCSRVNLSRVRDGFLAERDFPALQQAASKICGAHIFIDDRSDLTIQGLRGRARRMKMKYGIEVLFVDYLQLVRSNTKRAKDNRQLEVAEVSYGLKQCAKELHIPVVALAQISRVFEGRASGRPRLSDLRESGSIEQDADVVAFIVRPELYAETDEDRELERGRAELIIAKQRNGPPGDVPLTFLHEYARFETRASLDPEPGRVTAGDESFPV